jgi:PAS domain S-box-containing protein
MDFSLLDSVPDAIVIVDGRDGAIAYVNPVAEELFAWKLEELLGKPVEVLVPTVARSAHVSKRAGYQAEPRTRPMGLGVELSGLRKDGREFPAEISLSPLLAGGRHFAVAAVRDLTERRVIEERARLWRQALEEVRERDEFLSIASHELRTPVAALQLQLQTLQRTASRSAEAVPRPMMEKLEVLERQTRRIGLLVNALLDVSRLRLGRLELKREEVDLADLAREAVSHLREIAPPASPISFRAEGPCRGRWDRLRVEQVLTNLLVNAVKFGGGKPIAVAVDGDAATGRITVEDQGIGIALEHQERVFGRFERAVPAEQFGGLGLGLWIARQIVQAHGGAIRLRSVPGKGSTFTVELPRIPPEGAPPANSR